MWGSSRHMGAVDIFQDVYHPAVDSRLQLVETPHFLVRDLVSGEILHLAVTPYANNVAKGTLFNDGQELQQLVVVEDMALSDSLQRVCAAQQWADMQRIYTSFFFDRSSGHWLHHEGGQAQETAFRINAAKEALSRLGGFRYKFGTSKRARIMVFQSLILSTLYSGLESMVKSSAEYKRLDVCLLAFVRKLMREAATSKTVTDATIVVSWFVSFCD